MKKVRFRFVMGKGDEEGFSFVVCKSFLLLQLRCGRGFEKR